MTYFGFIYEWIDSTNGKNYVGSHKGSVDDKYEGSGIAWNKGIKTGPQSEEQKQKHSEFMKGENHPFYGKKHKEKSKQKISKKLKGVPWTAARRAAQNRRTKCC